jgi:5'-nucleotidase
MRILLSNDDGYRAPGVRELYRELSARAEVEMLAPDRNRSGASHSLTLRRPIRLFRENDHVMFIDGTPTDCVHLAINGVLEQPPDMVISGVNAGPNLGDDVLYSGTVAAAMEGRFLGYPAIAVSCASDAPVHYGTAARATMVLVEHVWEHALPSNTILNVNVPDVPFEQLVGFCTTRLGHRHQAEGVTRGEDRQGQPVFELGRVGKESDAGPGTDFDAIRRHFVSVTPLTTDLTHYQAMNGVENWLDGMK